MKMTPKMMKFLDARLRLGARHKYSNREFLPTGGSRDIWAIVDENGACLAEGVGPSGAWQAFRYRHCGERRPPPK